MAPLPQGHAQVQASSPKCLLEFHYPLPRRFHAHFGSLPVVGLALFPLGGGVLEALMSTLQHAMHWLRDRHGLDAQLERDQTLLLRDLSQEDLLLRRPSELPNQPQSVEEPDGPLSGVKLPRFDPIPIVVLELMVKQKGWNLAWQDSTPQILPQPYGLVTTGTSAAAAATAAAGVSRTLFARPGFIDGQGATLNLLSIQGQNSRLGTLFGGHGDECETARPPANLIHNEVNLSDWAVLGKHILEVVFDDIEGKVSNV